MKKISALVLAAGESKRLAGQNKLLLPFGGKTIIECTVDALLQADIDEVIVVLGHAAEAVRKALGERPIRAVYNPNYPKGMASSIQAGLAALSPTSQAVMIFLADLPLIQPAELNHLIAAHAQAKGKTITVPAFRGQRGNPVIFDLCYRAELLALQGDIGGKSILASHPQAVLEVEMSTASILEDIDTLEAYKRLLSPQNDHLKTRLDFSKKVI
ncbi:MAG: nucleotidyltransferase family protein [candidate division KSB1 bacterium]|nr:nucleotidyltransferase family protein [candidate division KSB1 bacterium]